MSRKRTRSNYRTEYYIDEKGVEQVRYVYIAGTYDFEGSATTFRALYALFSLLLAVAFVLPLCFATTVYHRIYFTIPYVFQIFCVGGLLWSAYVSLTTKPPYKDKTKRTLFDHGKVFCVIGELLAVAALVSFAVYLLLEGARGYDYAAVSCAAACAVLYFALYLVINGKKLPFTPSEVPADENTVEPGGLSDENTVEPGGISDEDPVEPTTDPSDSEESKDVPSDATEGEE